MVKASKSKKRKGRGKVAPEATLGVNPLTGLQKVAWLSVPMLGVVLLGCVSTLGVLFAIQPKMKSSRNSENRFVDGHPDSIQKRLAEKPESNKTEPDNPEQLKTNLVVETKTIPASESLTDRTALTPVASPTNPASPVASKASTGASSSITVSAKTLTSLNCVDGKIHFAGDIDLNFVDSQPSFETTEEGGVKFEHLYFGGTDQSVELPDVSKDAGSIELVCKMPARETSVVLDSNFQRLTVRKNKDGFRWRIDAKKKTTKIQLSPAQVDYDRWQHVVITWSDGSEAILYVNGVEQDRMDYVNEQPEFANFQKIVVGRTRGPNGRFYESRVHRYTVFDQPLTAAEIAGQYNAIKNSFPFIFQ